MKTTIDRMYVVNTWLQAALKAVEDMQKALNTGCDVGDEVEICSTLDAVVRMSWLPDLLKNVSTKQLSEKRKALDLLYVHSLPKCIDFYTKLANGASKALTEAIVPAAEKPEDTASNSETEEEECGKVTLTAAETHAGKLLQALCFNELTFVEIREMLAMRAYDISLTTLSKLRYYYEMRADSTIKVVHPCGPRRNAKVLCHLLYDILKNMYPEVAKDSEYFLPEDVRPTEDELKTHTENPKEIKESLPDKLSSHEDVLRALELIRSKLQTVYIAFKKRSPYNKHKFVHCYKKLFRNKTSISYSTLTQILRGNFTRINGKPVFNDELRIRRLYALLISLESTEETRKTETNAVSV